MLSLSQLAQTLAITQLSALRGKGPAGLNKGPAIPNSVDKDPKTPGSILKSSFLCLIMLGPPGAGG